MPRFPKTLPSPRRSPISREMTVDGSFVIETSLFVAHFSVCCRTRAQIASYLL